MRRLAMGVLCVVMLGGCGAQRMAPVAPQASGELKPDIKDGDAGLVGMRPGFAASSYTTIVLTPFTVAAGEIKDDEDSKLAKDMTAYFQAQLVRRLQAAAIFTTVIDATTSTDLTAEAKALRLEGDMTRLTAGSQAVRYFVGFGAGAAKAQIETRLVDGQSRRIELVTADRRTTGMGLFSGDGRQFVTESMDQMAEGYVKLLKHLAEGGQPGPRGAPSQPARR